MAAAWFNARFMERLLQDNEHNEFLTVTDLEIKPAVPEGDNYLGTLSRVTIKCKKRCNENSATTETRSLVVKTPPASEVSQKYISDIQAFKTEIFMYKIILPTMYQIVENTSMSNHVLQKSLAPIIFNCAQESILVLEDLKVSGYMMADRRQQLDLEHSLAVLRTLGHFHSLSIVLNTKYPTIMANVKENQFIESNRESENNFIAYRMEILASEIEKWPGYEHYADKIRTWIAKAVDVLMDEVRPVRNSLCVLNHGDCWVNNVLFHYNATTGKIDDVKFLDFQMSRFSSPALDLQHFMYTSVRDEVRSHNVEILLTEYHRQFRDTLRALGYDPDQFSFEQLKEEYIRKERYGFISACSKLSIVLGDPLCHLNEETDRVDAQKKSTGSSKYKPSKVLMKETFEKLLPYFERKGFL